MTKSNKTFGLFNKRLYYKLSKDELRIFKLFKALNVKQYRHKLELGMKVRATYIDPPLWMYGKIIRIAVEGAFIDIEVERTSLKYFKGYHLCFSTGNWTCIVEPFDY